MGALQNAVRREETRAELDRLQRELEAWAAHRRALDREQQYATQLTALEATVGAGLAVVRAELDAVDESLESGTVYAACRAVEEQVVFLRRYLDHFRDKFDQRDRDDDTRVTLLAAEEIVWSCWAGVFRALGEPVMPAPLPYLEPEFSPHARPRADPPRALRADARLRAAVGALPIPLIGLPPVCRERPWWLVHVAHETGHHVQYDVAGGALLASFRALVEDAADERWGGWHQELFADAFAALCTGWAADWALGELLLGDGAARSGYPPLAVRRALMAAALEAAAPEQAAAPAPVGAEASWPPPPDALAAAHALARSIAATPLAGDKVLPALCGFSPRRAAEAERWRGQLLDGPEPAPETTLAAARVTVAGAVAAWRDVAGEADAVRRAERREALARRARAVLAGSHPAGRRAPVDAAAPDLAGARDALVAALAQVEA